MTFSNLVTLMQAHVNSMCKDTKHLFEVQLDKDQLWNMYLDSFPAGTNEIYRKRREYDCSCCRHFIKQFGNVVSIDHGIVTTIWDFETEDSVFQPVLNALSESDPMPDQLRNTVLQINTDLLKDSEANRDLSEMATTLSGIYLFGESASVLHVGNTRVYAKQGNYLKQLASDHTVYNWLNSLGRF